MADKPINKGGRPANGRGRRVRSVYANDQEIELLNLGKSLSADRLSKLIPSVVKWIAKVDA